MTPFIHHPGISRRNIILGGLALTSLHGNARDLPPVKLLVGYPAGGTIDAIARNLAKDLAVELGRSVIVENRPGAGGQLAALALKNAKPDGTTLFLSNSHTISMVPLIVANPGFDPVRDFAPVGLVAFNPDIFVINPKATNFSEVSLKAFARWVNENPGKGNVGVPAVASLNEFVVSAISATLGSDFQPVPYKGGAPLIQDVVAGHVPAGLGAMGSVMEYVRTGQIKAVAINGASRHRLLPDVPTYTELGIPGYEDMMSTAVFAPAGLPPEMVQQFSAAISKVVRNPRFANILMETGNTPSPSTPAELAAHVESTNRSWKAMVTKLGHKPQ